MAFSTWDTVKVQFCERTKANVGLEAELVYPAEFLPDQAPRVLAHRCSRSFACNLFSQASCVWAGTNPSYDPFSEKA